MILEVATIDIQAGQEEAFEAALKVAAPKVTVSEGYLRHELHRGIENPSRYFLFVWWTSVEAHEAGFRQSERFPEWRRLIGPFFAAPPHVEHAAAVV